MEANLTALRLRQPASEAMLRYERTARLLTGNQTATAEEGVSWVRKLVADFQIPPLSSYGITRDDISAIVEKANQANSMRSNPIALTEQELAGIVERAL